MINARIGFWGHTRKGLGYCLLIKLVFFSQFCLSNIEEIDLVLLLDCYYSNQDQLFGCFAILKLALDSRCSAF